MSKESLLAQAEALEGIEETLINATDYPGELIADKIRSRVCAALLLKSQELRAQAERAPEAVPVGEVVDAKYNAVRFYRKPGDPTVPYTQPGTKLYTAPPAAEVERLRKLLRKVYEAACRGEIVVRDPTQTCGGGVYTLWSDIYAAIEPEKYRAELGENDNG